MYNKSIKNELDAVMLAIHKANEEWERHGGGGDDEYLEYLIQIAYLTLLAFLDKNGYVNLANYLTTKWQVHEKNLLDSFVTENVVEPMLRSTSTLWEVANSVNNILSSRLTDKPSPEATDIKTIMESLFIAAHRLKLELKKESDIDVLAEAVLITLFRDLNSNPSLSLPEGSRQPDSAILSQNTLIEYKYIAKKDDVRRIIDEMQADIRNYAQKPWRHLIFVVGQDEPFSTQEKLEGTISKEPSSFETISLALIVV